MSTIETLHRVVDTLPEAARVDLIQYISAKYDDYLPSPTDEEKAEYDALAGKLMAQRYEHYKQQPETAISAEESSRRLKEKYGWQ